MNRVDAIEIALSFLGEYPAPHHVRKEAANEEKLEGYELLWQTTHERFTVHLYCGRSRVNLNGKRRVWVSLENIRVRMDADDDPAAIGTGGNYCIDFSEHQRSPVTGLKEALEAALEAAKPATSTV